MAQYESMHKDFLGGGRDAPMSIDALEKKFIANCIYGGWPESHAVQSLAVLRGLRTKQVVDLAVLRSA
jgi:hypothetical protein